MFLIVKHTYSSADRIIQIHLCVFMEHKLIYDPSITFYFTTFTAGQLIL